MGKVKKQSHRFQYDKNRKKAWKRSRREAAIECEQIKHAWDSRKSVMANMRNMGLSNDANKSLQIPKAKDLLGKPAMEVIALSKLSEVSEKPAKQHVMEELEAEALRPQERRVRLSGPEAEYCMYMMNKYGEDFKKMARDRRNYYQDTPKQLKQKIKVLKSIPEQYQVYLDGQQSE